MDLTQAQARIDELKRLIEENNRRYYVESAPVISDYDYDMLMNELIALEKDFPSLVTPDSPTRHVGSDLASGAGGSREFAQYPHRYPMLSLGNTYDIPEVEAFAQRVAKSVGGGFSFSCELKFDGTAICLTYRHGRLARALTRGDGTVGDDVTRNALRIAGIPQELKGSGWPDEFEIRGEILMPYKAFDRLNAERIANEDEPFANPRNAASGSLKLLDPDEVGRRGLECTLYHMLGEDLPFLTHNEALSNAASWGLPISDKRTVVKDIDGIRDFIEHWDSARHDLPFATDGIVIKVNELPLQRELGYTSKFPRWAVAYKFKAEQALARINSIDYQVGRTGAVTPVANLSPVHLSGTVVKRATLHNMEQMQLLDIRVGDWVYVEKGGEIIPKITSVELSRREAGVMLPEFPTVCPDCGATLIREEGEAKWFCPNIDGCPTQIMGRLVHFLSRKAMNVIAGEATVQQLYNLGLVKTPADFYDLTRSDLLRLEGWKERSAERFLSSLDASRSAGFERVLFAIGIRFVGETTAKTIARHFGDMDAIMAASRDELLAVPDVGETIADSILEYFASPTHRDEITRLKKAGLQFSMTPAPKTSAPGVLTGKSIVISGNFSISRDEMKSLIEANGGRNSGSVSGKTSWLLAGEKPGPEKLRKAESLGVPVMTEEEFFAMIGRSGELNVGRCGEITGVREADGPQAEENGQLTLF